MSEIIYKYLPENRTGFNGDAGFFPDFTLACKPPSKQNDPFECNIVFKFNRKKYLQYSKHRDVRKIQLQGVREFNSFIPTKVLKEGRKKQFKLDKANPNLEKEVTSKFILKFKENIDNWVGIISFSKKNNDESMWDRYSSAHKGFVVGFKKNSPIFKIVNPEMNGIGLGEVKYTNTPSEIEIGNLDNIQPPKWVYYRKNENWRNEDEVRFVVPIPILKGKDVFYFPPEVIDSIIFGAKMDSKSKIDIVDFCNKSNFSHINFYQANIPLNSNFMSIDVYK